MIKMFNSISRGQYAKRFALFIFLLYAIPLNLENSPLLVSILFLSNILFFMHASICRCHDLNYSGFRVLWFLVPVINFCALVVLLAKPGKAGIGATASEAEPTQPASPAATNSAGPRLTKQEQLRKRLACNHPYKSMLLRYKD